MVWGSSKSHLLCEERSQEQSMTQAGGVTRRDQGQDVVASGHQLCRGGSEASVCWSESWRYESGHRCTARMEQRQGPVVKPLLKTSLQGIEGQALMSSFLHYSSYQQRNCPWSQLGKPLNSPVCTPRRWMCCGLTAGSLTSKLCMLTVKLFYVLCHKPRMQVITVESD